MKEKRTKEIKIRMTEDEHKALMHLCNKAQLAQWMRETCLSLQIDLAEQDRIKEFVAKKSADPDLIRQLSGIGNNLNQIARAVNTGDANSIELLTTLKRIENQIEALKA